MFRHSNFWSYSSLKYEFTINISGLHLKMKRNFLYKQKIYILINLSQNFSTLFVKGPDLSHRQLSVHHNWSNHELLSHPIKNKSRCQHNTILSTKTTNFLFLQAVNKLADSHINIFIYKKIVQKNDIKHRTNMRLTTYRTFGSHRRQLRTLLNIVSRPLCFGLTGDGNMFG